MPSKVQKRDEHTDRFIRRIFPLRSSKKEAEMGTTGKNASHDSDSEETRLGIVKEVTDGGRISHR